VAVAVFGDGLGDHTHKSRISSGRGCSLYLARALSGGGTNGHKYHIDRAKRLPPNLLSPEFATIGKQCFEELVNVQRELFENLQETNRHWLERVQYEATLASKFATKLTTTHSV
jgi:hypothetical protein